MKAAIRYKACEGILFDLKLQWFMFSDKRYYNAIGILKNGMAVKYHGINKNKLERFQAFVKKQFPDIDHINYYPKQGGKCELQVKI